MARIHRMVLLAALLAAAPVLAGCESMDNFDLENLDFMGLNKKKPLPGDRKPLFPGGVPGVTQGIPPEYMKSNVEQQQQLDSTAAAAAAAQQNTEPGPKADAAPEEKATAAVAPVEEQKPKPKRKVVRTPAQPAQPVQPAQPAPWPAPAQSQQQGSSPWPSAPANASR